jgi:hypothetical protein
LRDNPGFIILYSMFKDALLQRTGTCKVYPEFTEDEEVDEFLNVPDDQYALGAQEKEAANAQTTEEYQAKGWQLDEEQLWYIKEHKESQGPVDPMTGMATQMHTGVWCRTVKKMKVCIDPVAPEHMLISKRATADIDQCSYMAHREQKTASELIEMGYSKLIVDGLSEDGLDNSDMERASRMKGIDEDPSGSYSVPNRANRLIWVTEAYIKVDWNGDGIAEMRRVVHAGGGTTILENEDWDGPRPFAIISPILVPHRLIGLSMADQTMEFQLLKSTLWRQILDNLYLTNNPMKYVDPQAVNIDDILSPRVGGIVRPPADGVFKPDGIFPITVEPVASASYPMLEYIDSERQNRTGVTKYNQGTDADSLNKTARGITQIMTASQQRIELIARVFAEGIKRIFSLQNFYIRKYPDLAKRAVRLRNKEWVEMDPSRWGGDFDLQINVGLGTGNKDQMLGHLQSIAAIQKEIVTLQQGVQGPLVTAKNIYETAKKIVENSGFKNADEFFTDPSQENPNAPPPQEPQPDPEMVKVQAQIEGDKAKLQMDGQKMQMEQQGKQQQAMLDEQSQIREYQLKEKIALLEYQLKERIAVMEFGLKEKMAQEDNELKRIVAISAQATKNEVARAKPNGKPAE